MNLCVLYRLKKIHKSDIILDMRVGKLNAEELKEYVFSFTAKTRDEVVLSAALGEDCAALKADGYILLSSDPITAAMECDSLGSLSIDVACNDIAANGGEAIAVMLTVIMPVSAKASQVGEIMQGASKRASEIGVDIIGGHTEFSDCVTRPIVSATAVGKAKRLICKSSLSEGDDVYITKLCGIEGTVILAEKYPSLLTETDRRYLKEFGEMLSVKKESEILKGYEQVTTMHDVTEGGIVGAVAELVQSAGLSAQIYEDCVPVAPVTEKLCKELKIDPLKLISSGSMMFTGKNLDSAIEELKAAGIAAHKIGRITKEKENVLIRKSGKKESFSTEPDRLLSALINGN